MENRHYRIMESASLERIIRNPVEEAIYDVLGGVNAAANALGVVRGTIYYLIDPSRAWPLTDRRTAVRIEEATTKAGCQIPAAELLDLPGSPWLGPERHPDKTVPGRKKREREGMKKALQRQALKGLFRSSPTTQPAASTRRAA